MTAFSPYGDIAASAIYHLLFADDPSAFAARDGTPPAPWQALLAAEPGDAAAIRGLADDPAQESRVRALACLWLRLHGEPVAAKTLFGVVVEVPLDSGLDVLAAYDDGGVRYLNQSGAMSIFEGAVPALQGEVRAALDAARTVVARIGPWDKPRLPPPVAGNVRLSFIVSDGLYFGEGPYQALAQDGLAGPLLQHATALLQAVVAMTAPAGGR
mgnify:CR=1 FL=1